MPRIPFALKTEKDGSTVLIYDACTRRECRRASRLSPFSRRRRRRRSLQGEQFVTEVIEIPQPGSSAELEFDPFYSSS